MAWTAPRTWVDDEVVTAALLNTHVRDNELVLDTHGHDGTSGEGSSTLGNLVKETMTDAAAPAAPGAGLTSIYTVTGKPHYRAGAGGADTELSEVGHGHTFVEDVNGSAQHDGSAGSGGNVPDTTDIAASGGTKSVSAVLSTSDANMIAAFGAFCYMTGGGVDPDHKHELIIDGVSVTSETSPVRETGSPTALNGSRATSSGSRTSTYKLTNSDAATLTISKRTVVEAVAVII